MTLKQRIEHLVSGRAFPLTRQELLTAADDTGAEPDVVTALQALDDEHFAHLDELRTRLDQALGMPDGEPGRSALEGSTEP